MTADKNPGGWKRVSGKNSGLIASVETEIDFFNWDVSELQEADMATQKTRRETSRPLEATILALGRKVSDAVPKAQGTIVLRCSDTGAEFALEGLGSRPRVTSRRGEGAHQVEITGPEAILRAVIEGRQEASRALVAGGIRVRGDLPYLEAVLKDLGLLECE